MLEWKLSCLSPLLLHSLGLLEFSPWTFASSSHGRTKSNLLLTPHYSRQSPCKSWTSTECWFSRMQTQPVSQCLLNSGHCFCTWCEERGLSPDYKTGNLTSRRPSVVPSWLEGVSARAAANVPDWKEGTVVLDCCSALIKNTGMLLCANQTMLSQKKTLWATIHTKGWWAHQGFSENPL